MVSVPYFLILPFLSYVLGYASSVTKDENREQIDRSLPPRQGRKLFGEICPANETLIEHYFEVIISIQPDPSVTAICTLGDQMMMGYDINSILSSHAIGYSGIDLTVEFKAAVCTNPNKSSSRRMLQRYSSGTFVWRGGGGCSGCFCDCTDARRKLQSVVIGTTEWFNNVYVPQLKSSIANAIMTTVVPEHPKCLGTLPIVGVEVTKITKLELISRFECYEGRIISLLETMSISFIPSMDRECNRCVKIDFSMTPTGDVLPAGTKISKQWQQESLTIQATNGIINKAVDARIINTGDATCLRRINKVEFGSPNQSCRGGGVGLGIGGMIGTDGENCNPVGNALIVQEFNSKDTCPNPSSTGGTLSFLFDTPVFFHDLGVLDMDEPDSRLQVTYSDNVVEFFNFVRFGDNSVQRVVVGKPYVKKLELQFTTGTGAVTELEYCKECKALAGHDDNHDCIVAGNTVNKVLEVIEMNSFEEQDSLVALKGWINGRIEKSQTSTFSKFLGLYTVELPLPYKTFNVPRRAETIIMELDFYEIDGWNLGDGMAVYIDGEEIAMDFDVNVDEGRQTGRTPLGLNWTSISMGSPKNLGYLKSLDQKHHITIEVPSTSQLYIDGELRLKLWCGATLNGTESAGWDNVKVTARYGCSQLTSMPALTGPSNPSIRPTANPTKSPLSPTTSIPTRSPIIPVTSLVPTRPPTTSRASSAPTKPPTTSLPTKPPTRR